MRITIPTAIAAAATALCLAACGSSSKSSTQSPSGSSSGGSSGGSSSRASGSSGASSAAPKSTLDVAADPGGALMFQPTELVAKAGKVTIHFTNKSPENHDLSVQQGSNGTVLGSTGAFDGATKTLTVTLKPGKYTFFCNVPGHRASGMVGTIVVKG